MGPGARAPDVARARRGAPRVTAQTRSTDHVARARERMLGQFRKAPILRALVSIRARRWQEIETAAWEVADKTASIEDSIGVGLDAIGVLVGRGRDGASDDVYRIALRAQIRINRSAGQIADTLDVLSLSTGGTPHALETGHAAYQVWQDETSPAGEGEALAVNLEQVRPLGVRGRLSTTTDAATRARWGHRPGDDFGSAYASRSVPSSAPGTRHSHGRVL